MKILIIDDSVFIQNIISRAIKEKFPEVQIGTCSNGKQGYEFYLVLHPDLIITDLLMPEMTGQELIKRIRKTDDNTNIIVVSADVQKATKNEVEGFSISGFINKPVNSEKINQLLNLVHEVSYA